MKLKSTPGFPVNFVANGVPTNLVTNLTPGGKYQVARVLTPGGAEGGVRIAFRRFATGLPTISLSTSGKGFSRAVGAKQLNAHLLPKTA